MVNHLANIQCEDFAIYQDIKLFTLHAVAVFKEVHYLKPFVGPLIWSLALLADSWLRLWRQLWQQRRCRDLGRSGSSASPSPTNNVTLLCNRIFAFAFKFAFANIVVEVLYRSVVLPLCIVQFHTGPDPWLNWDNISRIAWMVVC